MYSEQQQIDLEEFRERVWRRLSAKAAELIAAAEALGIPEVTDYLFYGAGRRCLSLAACIEIIFDLFPPDAARPLSGRDRAMVQAALQSYMINVFGLIDNLGWAFLLRHGLTPSPTKPSKWVLPGVAKAFSRTEISLMHERTQEVLPVAFADYLQGKQVVDWYWEHLVHFRDALAHRIPLYVVPSVIDPANVARARELDRLAAEHNRGHRFELRDQVAREREELESPVPWYRMGISTQEQMVVLHPQVLSDGDSSATLVEQFLANFHQRR